MAQKRNDRGSVKKQANGKWKATVTIGYDEEGGQKRKSKTFAKKSDAVDWIDNALRQYKGINLSKDGITLQELYDDWLIPRENEVAASTYSRDMIIAKILLDSIGNACVADLRHGDYQKILNKMANDGYASGSISLVKNIAAQLVKYAMENDIIKENPLAVVSIPRSAKKKSDRILDAFTKKEQDLINQYWRSIPFGDIVYLLINTGLRGQELCAINDESIVKENEQYYVNVVSAMKRVKSQWNVGVTKNEYSMRMVPISNECVKIIKTRLLQSQLINGHRYLLTNKTKTNTISYSTFKLKYDCFMDDLQAKTDGAIRKLEPHCCRKTYATNLQKKGVPIQTAMKLTGHNKLDTLFECYTKLHNEDIIVDLKKAGIM